MKKVYVVFFIISALLLFSTEVYSQEKEIGFNVGFGNSVIDEYGQDRIFVSPFDVEQMYLYRFGICYYYTPPNSIFAIRTGLDYDIRSESISKLNYLRSPLGIEFKLGNDLQLLVGGGFFLSYLFSTSGSSLLADSENSIRKFQLGWFANTGVGFQITPNHNFSIRYHYNADISKMFETSLSSPGGAQYTLDAKGYDGIISLCLRYKLNLQ